MAMYQVWAVCNACGDNHSMGIKVNLSGEPVRQSLAGAFPNKDPPQDLAAVKTIRLYCPKLGRRYAQKDDRKIILVPVGLSYAEAFFRFLLGEAGFTFFFSIARLLTLS